MRQCCGGDRSSTIASSVLPGGPQLNHRFFSAAGGSQLNHRICSAGRWGGRATRLSQPVTEAAVLLNSRYRGRANTARGTAALCCGKESGFSDLYSVTF